MSFPGMLVTNAQTHGYDVGNCSPDEQCCKAFDLKSPFLEKSCETRVQDKGLHSSDSDECDREYTKIFGLETILEEMYCQNGELAKEDSEPFETSSIGLLYENSLPDSNDTTQFIPVKSKQRTKTTTETTMASKSTTKINGVEVIIETSTTNRVCTLNEVTNTKYFSKNGKPHSGSSDKTQSNREPSKLPVISTESCRSFARSSSDVTVNICEKNKKSSRSRTLSPEDLHPGKNVKKHGKLRKVEGDRKRERQICITFNSLYKYVFDLVKGRLKIDEHTFALTWTSLRTIAGFFRKFLSLYYLIWSVIGIIFTIVGAGLLFYTPPTLFYYILRWTPLYYYVRKRRTTFQAFYDNILTFIYTMYLNMN